ncbi:hypothetical protein Cyast_1466 [Cyanobacterium stanieri PCC 7202]|uniref:Uncharacterized protein n=1 Tax=Cyanobacterium stanieri (strain ATCC 29140 / PCC 7202) TaxID=292563 RepID=K9YKN6_CYASC|nr:hypothetical protein Cyast_1466 [Cyanobacterium stanieri PCC 7202]
MAIALASLAGLTLVSNNGASDHLARVFDSVAVSSAQAQTSPSPAPVPQQPDIVPLDLLIEQSGAERIVIEDNRAVGIFEDGTAVPLADGNYTGEGINFTVENMTVTSCEGCEEEGEALSAEYCVGGSCDEHTESGATPENDIFSPVTPTENPTSPTTPVPPASEQTPMDDQPGISPSVEPVNPSSPMDNNTPGSPF